MSFIPHSENDTNQMLNDLDLNTFDDLFAHIPNELYLKTNIDIEESKSELELIHYFNNLASKNVNNLVCFAGGGHYDNYLPHTVKSLTMRPEFMTSYTPYQSEISQGVLQALFEYQSLVADLTDMEMSNASLYDGATSVVEAVSMSIVKTKRNKVLISEGINKRALEALNTIIDTDSVMIKTLKYDSEFNHKNIQLNDDIACVVFAVPTTHGSIQNLSLIHI